MNKLLLTAVISCSFILSTSTLIADDKKSGFGFGMGSSTPERSGRNYGWGFGSPNGYDETEDGIEQSTATGGMSWGDGNQRYRDRSRPFFGFGSSRGRYGPPPGWGYYPPPGWGYYPPHPQYQQPPVAQPPHNGNPGR